MSPYFPLTQPALKTTDPTISVARNWEIFVRPRAAGATPEEVEAARATILAEDEQVSVYEEGEDGAAVLSQPLYTGRSGRIGEGSHIGWVKGPNLPLDIWGRPKGSKIDWQILPEGDQAVVAGGAAAEAVEAIQAEVAVVKEAPLNVEYPEYGADGTRATDSIAAFEKAIAALPVAGGKIFCPRLYKLSGQLNLEGKRRIVFVGQAGVGTGNDSCSQLLFTQGGSSALINPKNADGFVMQDLQVEYTNSGLTGAVVDLREAFKPVLERVQLVGAGGPNSALGIDLDKAECGSFRDLQISGMDVGIKGKASDGSFSNIMSFEGLVLSQNKTAHMKNAGESWKIGVTFEPLVSGAAGGYTADAGVRAYGTVFITSWNGDASTSGTQILWRGKGLSIVGGSLGSGALGVSVPDAASEGIEIGGVRFGSLTDAIRLATGVSHYKIGANAYESSVTGKKVSLDGGATDAGAGFLSN